MWRGVSFFFMLTLASSAFSWESAVEGFISRVEVSGNSFRVMLDGYVQVCEKNGTVGNTAIMLNSDGNYNTFLSVLLSAKTTRSKVSLFTNLESTGFCRIEYIIVI